MRLLIIGGASGYLGQALTRHCDQTDIEAIPTACTHLAPGVIHLDLRDPETLESILNQTAPDTVINTAAAIDDWTVTATGAANIARACATSEVHLVHVSSDAVHSGTKTRYTEADHPDPVTPYGAAKAAAELAVAALHPAATIARTSWIIGGGHSPFERLVHRLAAEPDTGTLFRDDRRCPVHVDELAAALVTLAAIRHVGIVNLAGREDMNRAELGRLIAARDGLVPDLLPIGSRNAIGQAGQDIRLDTSLARSRLNLTLTSAREFLSTP